MPSSDLIEKLQDKARLLRIDILKMLNNAKWTDSKNEYNGKEYGWSVFKSLTSGILNTVKQPVWTKVQNDASESEVDECQCNYLLFWWCIEMEAEKIYKHTRYGYIEPQR